MELTKTEALLDTMMYQNTLIIAILIQIVQFENNENMERTIKALELVELMVEETAQFVEGDF